MSDFKAKMLYSKPHLGACNAPPYPLAIFKGPHQRRVRGEEGRGVEEKGRESGGREGAREKC